MPPEHRERGEKRGRERGKKDGEGGYKGSGEKLEVKYPTSEN